jgi:hypothetical protein
MPDDAAVAHGPTAFRIEEEHVSQFGVPQERVGRSRRLGPAETSTCQYRQHR